MAYNIEEIASKLIYCAEFDVTGGGEYLCNLKLQKLLYYEQGHYLAKFDKPLFDEEIEAWMHGPVVPAIYEKYKGYKRLGIKEDKRLSSIIGLETEEEEDFFLAVYEHYKDYSPRRLANKTHREDPWKSVLHGKGNVISKDSIRNYFLNNPL